jgi:hypothetical protein
VQQAADIGAVHDHAAAFQFHAQFVQRQFPRLSHSLAHEGGMRRKLAATWCMALAARLQRASLPPQLHQLVHEPRRNPEMPRRLPVPMSLVNIRSNTNPQRHR